MLDHAAYLQHRSGAASFHRAITYQFIAVKIAVFLALLCTECVLGVSQSCYISSLSLSPSLPLSFSQPALLSVAPKGWHGDIKRRQYVCMCLCVRERERYRKRR